MVGTTVAQYRIVEVLGRGAMGVVYKAIDETLSREVAIKVVKPEIADPRIVAHFKAEAGAGARLNHPRIATVHELFGEDGHLLMVMEFVRGETLERRCTRTGSFALDEAVSFVDQILSALEHAHDAGVVHCDMKPANVMAADDGTIKIMDFGTARVHGHDAIAAGHVMGTPAYMPPEQLLGHPIDGRADLYAVGVILYRLLTGTLPFVAETTLAMAHKQLAGTPEPLCAHRRGLPAWIEPIVTRALAKAPESRFQTAREFREALRTGTSSTTATRQRSVALNRRIAVVAAMVPSIAIVALWHATAVPARVGVKTPPPPVTTMPQQIVPTPEPSLEVNRAPTLMSDDRARAASVQLSSMRRRPAIVFEARTFVGATNSAELRDCDVVLAKTSIVVRDATEHAVLRAVPYDRVVSITYSHGRDPLWRSPTGPVPAARASGGLFRFLSGSHHWITLRTRNPRSLLALQFTTDKDAARAIDELRDRSIAETNSANIELPSMSARRDAR